MTIEEFLLPPTNFVQDLPPLAMEQMEPLDRLYRDMRNRFDPKLFRGRPFVVRSWKYRFLFAPRLDLNCR